MEAVRAYLESQLERTRARMREVLSSDIALLDGFNQSVMDRPGKMVRPSLCLLAADLAGGINPLSISVSAAAELLHNATLMHDDVVDGAAERRGLPTAMSLMGPSAAVLLGDYWLVKAVKCLIGAGDSEVLLVRLFARTLSDLAEGELLQMQKAESLDTIEEDYLRIIYCKTASLFELAARSGAISAGASAEKEEALAAFGRNVGLAFQIRDDILDYEGGAIGKPSRIDLRERKITLPLLLSDASGSLREELRRGNIDRVYDGCVAGGGIDRAYERIRVYIDAAVAALSVFPQGAKRDRLVAVADFIADRKL